MSPTTTTTAQACSKEVKRSIDLSKAWTDASARKAVLLAEVSALLAEFAASDARLSVAGDAMIRRRCARRTRRIVISLAALAAVAAAALLNN